MNRSIHVQFHQVSPDSFRPDAKLLCAILKLMTVKLITDYVILIENKSGKRLK